MNTIISVIVVILLLWIYYIYLNHPTFNSVEYNDIKHKVKTGDIILFHALDNINPIFIGCYYTHIGIVYIKDNTPYLFEATLNKNKEFCNEKYKNGVVLTLLENRINTYRGYVFYKELIKPVIDEQKIQTFKKYINYSVKHLEYTNSNVCNFMDHVLFNDDFYNYTNCGEVVYCSLLLLGILPKEYYKNRRHHYLLFCSYLHKKNIYKEPVYLYSNFFCSDNNNILELN